MKLKTAKRCRINNKKITFFLLQTIMAPLCTTVRQRSLKMGSQPLSLVRKVFASDSVWTSVPSMCTKWTNCTRVQTLQVSLLVHHTLPHLQHLLITFLANCLANFAAMAEMKGTTKNTKNSVKIWNWIDAALREMFKIAGDPNLSVS